VDKKIIDALLQKITDRADQKGHPRTQAIVHRIMRDLFYTIDDFDVSANEFWSAIDYLTGLGRDGEFGLLAAGLGFEHFLDVRLDMAEAAAGISGATPRTIEGPLYVAGAPQAEGHARLDDSATPGEPLVMRGRIVDQHGAPLAAALVEVWHANQRGMYSHFDKTQSSFNLRRSIRADANGAYSFRSIIPNGYSVPEGGPTEALLRQLGRHGQRPAHIHFFVWAPGYRKLTTQINIAGDPYLWDDFAFATRAGLVPALQKRAGADGKPWGIDGHFTLIDFDFVLQPERADVPLTEVTRVRATA